MPRKRQPKRDAAPVDAKEVEKDPAKDNAATFDKVLELIGSGLSTRNACIAAGLDPRLGPSILWKWAQRDDDSRTRYARARDSQARAMADDTVGIADAATPETAQVAKIQGDARRWLASKLLPREYGERLEVDSRQLVASIDYSKLTDAQISRILSGEPIIQVLSTPSTPSLGPGDPVPPAA